MLRTEVGCEHERLVRLHVLVDQCPQFLLEYCLLSAPKLQAPVVQTMDSAIHWISNSETNCNIQWIVIYPVDSVIQMGPDV